jgi:8-oxo-dGTP diphosphatase
MSDIQLFKIAVSAFIVKQNKLLVLKRSDDDNFLPGKWEVLGGGLGIGESISQGVMREVMEEAGVKVTVGDIFGYFEFKDGKGRPTVNLNFLCTLDSVSDEVNVIKGEMQEARWLRLEDFEDVEFTSETMKNAGKKALGLSMLVCYE